MLIEGNLKTNKTEMLINKYVELVDSGVNADEIIVLCLNSYRKQEFVDKVKEKIATPILVNPRIYTFLGLCYNIVSEEWANIENKINFGKTVITPNLCGLEVSQFIFKQSIKKSIFKDYGSKINLLHQLFRRYSLIVQNGLNSEQIKQRSQILNESFENDCNIAIDRYKYLSLDTRSFDYLRQLSIFSNSYKNSVLVKKAKHLIVDDADEFTYLSWKFINEISPNLQSISIAYDKKGASRCGYLSAYKTGVYNFKEITKEKPIILENNSEISKEANLLYDNILNCKKTKSKLIDFKEKTNRLEMIESACLEIEKLIKIGVTPSEITIITPNIDEILKFAIEEFFENKKTKFQILSGNEKIYENQAVKNALLILKLANPEWKIKIDSLDIRSLFINLLKIPLKYCRQIFSIFNNEGFLPEFDFQDDEFNKKYKKLLEIIEKLHQDGENISKKLLHIYNSILIQSIEKEDLKKFSFLIKEIESFEKAFPKASEKEQKEFITQIENTIISENPSYAEEIDENSILISTPQKAIDFELKSNYQLWLDTSDHNWQKQDIGPLYNAWVFNRDWVKEDFTFEDNTRLTREKTARILRKLMLCCNKKIYAHSSLFDSCGNENFGGILDFFELKNSQNETKEQKKITPREDQKPVLAYEKGEMGIMAVPGAGKTTILLALIVKLLKMEINPENIFVLTYMESAARNFKERIKNNYPEFVELPSISTIHGLALRIIKENANYAKLGLSDTFEICDDNQRQKIIYEALFKLNLDEEKFENYEKAISAIKLSANKTQQYSKHKDIKDFIRFYQAYNNLLRTNNLIDYDDMLALAVQLLEENSDIKEYYSNLCLYIVEDEAQDSSSLQQKLISLLASKHQNIIRCGDVNQSITATFTNSDLKNFTAFLRKNKCVEMASSQRCSKPVYTLANDLVEYATKKDTMKNAFYQIKMKPTKNNPEFDENISAKLFKTDSNEKNFILKESRKILSLNPKATIAILLRNNFQVNDYNSFLEKNGLKTITRNDCLAQKPIFKIIFSVIKIAFQPWNNKNILDFARILTECELIKFSQEQFEYIKNLDSPFITTDLEELKSKKLTQLYIDSIYWIENSYLSFDDLATKAGLYYFSTTIEKSNIFLISMIIRRLLGEYKKSETIIEKLESLSKRPSMANFKFFTDQDTKEESNAGMINIMTVHKSKGDEFDFVFIPELNEDNYAISLANTKVKANTHFIETIKNLNQNYNAKTPEELKTEQIEENLRLLYVGFTRAKLKLYLSCAHKNLKRKSPPKSILFESFLEATDEE